MTTYTLRLQTTICQLWQIWKNLPNNIVSAESSSSFLRLLKTFLFQQSLLDTKFQLFYVSLCCNIL